jgi:hypothetical protein
MHSPHHPARGAPERPREQDVAAAAEAGDVNAVRHLVAVLGMPVDAANEVSAARASACCLHAFKRVGARGHACSAVSRARNGGAHPRHVVLAPPSPFLPLPPQPRALGTERPAVRSPLGG